MQLFCAPLGENWAEGLVVPALWLGLRRWLELGSGVRPLRALQVMRQHLSYLNQGLVGGTVGLTKGLTLCGGMTPLQQALPVLSPHQTKRLLAPLVNFRTW